MLYLCTSPSVILYHGSWFSSGERFDCIVTDPPKEIKVGDIEPRCSRYYIVGGSVFLKKPKDKIVPGRKDVTPYAELIKAIAPRPLLIVDPFMGSGSVGIAALAADIPFLGFEVKEARVHYAAQRYADVGLKLHYIKGGEEEERLMNNWGVA